MVKLNATALAGVKGDKDWWRSAVIYQIYPRSFNDSNHDGVGDLAGITQKLPYIAELGVDAIWISPFFKSPMKDFGYDVSDYESVDPLFGSMEDFETMIDVAHQHGLRVLMDQVLSHTSDQHPWFIESRRDRTNPKADWYVWADAKPDGSAPNNWLALFGGSAWEWDETRQQYYMHNFLTSQPDLNFHNPEMMDALLDSMRFWLDRGVDGFRLDTVNYYTHDALLRDNPMRADHEPPAESIPNENPYSRQHHVYDKSRPENFQALKRIRALLDEYPGLTTVGEIGDDNSMVTAPAYVQGTQHLHMVYTFQLLDAAANFNAELIRQTVAGFEKNLKDGWLCWAFSNHDVKRAVSRLSGDKPSADYAKVLLATLLVLRGSACIYQGEELGLTEAEIPFEQMRDPYGLAFYPEFKGRDGCRTPMPWQQQQPHAGFSSTEPWLPIPQQHLRQAVDIQDPDPESVLNAYRTFIQWRKHYPALLRGDITFLNSDPQLLVLQRHCDEQTLLVAINLTQQSLSYNVENASGLTPLEGHGFMPLAMIDNMITIPPHQAFFAVVDN